MRALIALTAALCVMELAPPHAAAQALVGHYDFRGATMGMPLAEWKAAPPPSQLMHPATASCSDGPPNLVWGGQTAGMKKLGVVECTYLAVDGIGRVNQHIGGSEITGASYYFLDGRLYSISLLALVAASSDLEGGLRARFGEPASATRGTFQTRAGGEFPQWTFQWLARGESVTLRTPSLTINHASVDYEITGEAERVRQADRTSTPDAEKM